MHDPKLLSSRLTPRWFGGVLSAVTWLAIAIVATPAAAQSDATARAEQLFQEGKQLMKAEKYAEACAKLAESQELDPATGTLLNLATCHEAAGKTTTALNEFRAAREQAEQAKQDNRVQLADEHIRALQARLCWLSIEVPDASRTDGLKIEIDGQAVAANAWGTQSSIDPGQHKVRATAPGKQPWEQEIELKGDGAREAVSVPVLQPIASEAVPPPPVSSEPEVKSPGSQSPPSEPIDQTEGSPTPSSVYWMGGTTLLLGAGAGVTGALYLSKRSDYNQKRNDPLASKEDRSAARKSASTLGVTNAVLCGATAVSAGITAILYFTRPTEQTTATLVSPWFTVDAAGVVANGSF